MILSKMIMSIIRSKIRHKNTHMRDFQKRKGTCIWSTRKELMNQCLKKQELLKAKTKRAASVSIKCRLEIVQREHLASSKVKTVYSKCHRES